ncbi:MAG: Inner membrane protein YjcH [Burkholderiaceae bacterium]|nr:Inner membrane protein YjcH [Burkholderiaceae bacterium]
MENDLTARIVADPRYQQLKRARSRFGWWLTLAMLIVYYGFILLVAFDKSFLAARIGAGVTTIGMPIGLGVIVFTIIITGIYVQRANKQYDDLTEQIVKGALK